MSFFFSNDRAFKLTSEAVSLNETALRQGVQVEYLDWVMASDEMYEGSRHEEIAIARLKAAGASLDTHVIVGEHYEDLSGWCPAEEKFEYMHEHIYLVLPREVVSPVMPNAIYYDKAAEMGFRDWA